jgi:hypothetical protein
MTPTYDFSDITSGYAAEFEGHNEPFEYATFGWARLHSAASGN